MNVHMIKHRPWAYELKFQCPHNNFHVNLLHLPNDLFLHHFESGCDELMKIPLKDGYVMCQSITTSLSSNL
jgi:hypothetical protein